MLDLAGAAVNQHVKKECAAKPSMFTVFTVFPGPKKKKSGFLGKQSRCTFFWLIDTSEEYAKKSVDNKSATVSIILVMIMKLQTRDCLTGLSLVLSCL